MSKINYIVDTDIALGTLNADPDDGVAILNLLSKNIDIALVSLVSGNVKIVEAYDNLNFLLNSIVCDKKFHVFEGFSNDSSFQDKFFFWREWQDQLDFSYKIQDKIIDVKNNIDLYFKNENVLFGLGPLTNISHFIEKNYINKHNSKIFWMGGNNLGGDFFDEFNISFDIDSFKNVLNSGIELYIFPLNQTKRVEIEVKELKYNLVKNEFINYYKKLFESWNEILVRNEWAEKGITFHDSLPIFCYLNPDKVNYINYSRYKSVYVCSNYDLATFKKFILNNL